MDSRYHIFIEHSMGLLRGWAFRSILHLEPLVVALPRCAPIPKTPVVCVLMQDVD